MNRIACIAIGLTLSLGVLGHGEALAQDQSGANSLGDYARQVRKTPAGAKAKVYDNDNLPTKEKLSIIGPGPAATSEGSATETKTEDTAKAPAENHASPEGTPATSTKAPESAPAKSETTEAKAAEEKPAAATTKSSEDETAEKQAAWKQWGDRISAQKDQIDLMKRELDVVQREYQLRAAAMYGDAGNRLRNENNWDKEDADFKQKIADKQKALEEAKQKLDDMQEDARKAGVPASIREP